MLYILIIGISAFLLFQVQPMMAKLLLPTFGGGAFIWLTAIVFFQLLLLGGYAACHFVVKKGGIRVNLGFQVAILLLSLFFIPLAIPFYIVYDLSLYPALGIFLLLFLSVGLPYFVLSTTSPTLQYWMAVDEKSKSNPYLQYAVSNGGSLLGLLIYPLFIERFMNNSSQLVWWSLGYGVFVVLMIAVSLTLWPQIQRRLKENKEKFQKQFEWENPSLKIRLQWLFQSLIPSAALIIITHHLNVDIINFPLLWVIPLVLYLLSFILVFSLPRLSQPAPWRKFFLLAALILIILSRYGLVAKIYIHQIFFVEIAIACLFLFVLCLYFHGNLYWKKPPPKELTSFYLYLSLGGCLGSILTGILAPMLFPATYEFEILLVTILAWISYPEIKSKALKVVFSLLLIIVLCNPQFFYKFGPQSKRTLHYRSFYGTYVISDEKTENRDYIKDLRIMISGNTVHGGQSRNREGELYPIAYYCPPSGIGKYFEAFEKKEEKKVGVVGLGTGVLALYGQKGDHFDFFEIDPLVKRMAQEHFDNLKTSQAKISIYLGDARLKLREIPKDSYDLLVLDAFTSDAIPSHLLTLEAVEEYLRVLKPKGIILYHISNRHVNLRPLMRGLAQKLDLHLMFHSNASDENRYYFQAQWAALTRDNQQMEKLCQSNPNHWRSSRGKSIYWTDDYSSLWPLLKVW